MRIWSFGREGIGTVALVRRTLLAVLFFCLAIGASGFYVVLRERAVRTASEEARLLLDAATAVSTFTDEQAFPLLDKLPKDQFYKQVVPFFVADAVFRRLRAQHPAYTFRQTALNPTNPSDRPTPHEVELIDRFRDDPGLTLLEGTRRKAGQTLFYLARPITVRDRQCLTCHSTPAAAPPAMLAAYGGTGTGGFGWKLNETVGMTELSVPVTDELRSAAELAALLAAGLLIIFLLIYLVLTATLGAALVRPLRHLADAAEASSLSSDARVEIPRSGTKELLRLSDAFERLELSLRKALHQLSGSKPPPTTQGPK